MTGIVGSGGGGGGYDYVQNPEPADPEEGEEWYDTGENKAFVYDGAAWIEQTVTAHGALSGLSSDDHPQYATDNRLDTHEADASRHHARYSDAEAAAAARPVAQGAPLPVDASSIRFGNETVPTGILSKPGLGPSNDDTWYTVGTMTLDVSNRMYVRFSGEVRYTGSDSHMTVNSRVRFPDGETREVAIRAQAAAGTWYSGSSGTIDVTTDTGQKVLDIQVMGDSMDGTDNAVEVRNVSAEYNLTEDDVA